MGVFIIFMRSNGVQIFIAQSSDEKTKLSIPETFILIIIDGTAYIIDGN